MGNYFRAYSMSAYEVIHPELETNTRQSIRAYSLNSINCRSENISPIMVFMDEKIPESHKTQFPPHLLSSLSV